jgi:hypothetical protein
MMTEQEEEIAIIVIDFKREIMQQNEKETG